MKLFPLQLLFDFVKRNAIFAWQDKTNPTREFRKISVFI